MSRAAALIAWPRVISRRPAIARGGVVMADQAVVSLTNFVTTVLIGRVCLADELGLYALGFSVLVFVSGVPKALVWSPYTAFYPQMKSEERAAYSGSATLQLLMVAIVSAIALLACAGIATVAGGESRLAALFLFLAPAVLFSMIREHARRLCLAWLEAAEVLLLDVAVSLMQLAGLILLIQSGSLSGTTAYAVVTVASAASLGWLWLRRSELQFDFTQARAHLGRNWTFAKWLFGGAVAILASHAAYRWGLSYLHGMTEVGVLASAQGVVMFANPLLLGLGNYFAPATATTYANHGLQALYRSVIHGTLAVLACVVPLFVVLVACGGWLVSVVYGGQFAGHHHVIVSLALGLFSEALLVPIELGWLALDRPRLLFRTAMFRLTVTMTLGLLLVVQWGAVGVGYGLLAGNAVVFVWQWMLLRKRVDDG